MAFALMLAVWTMREGNIQIMDSFITHCPKPNNKANTPHKKIIIIVVITIIIVIIITDDTNKALFDASESS